MDNDRKVVHTTIVLVFILFFLLSLQLLFEDPAPKRVSYKQLFDIDKLLAGNSFEGTWQGEGQNQLLQ